MLQRAAVERQSGSLLPLLILLHRPQDQLLLREAQKKRELNVCLARWHRSHPTSARADVYGFNHAARVYAELQSRKQTRQTRIVKTP